MKENSFTEDIIRDFYNNINYRKLSAQEEIHYIKKSKLSFYDEVDEELKNIYFEYYCNEFPRFKRKYEKASLDKKKYMLEQAILNSTEWRSKFLENNQRLVFKWAAKKYKNVDNLTLMDLIQEGNFGLIKALKKFDIDMGYRFSTYASEWINQAIVKAIVDTDKAIRVPFHTNEQFSKVKRAIKNIENTTGQTPTIEEISEMTGVPVNTVKRAVDYINNKSRLVSLDTPVGEEEDTLLGDFIESDDVDFTLTFEDEKIIEEFREILKSSNLQARELSVLTYRYGLNDGQSRTLEEVGEIFNVTRERIRQIEYRALQKLRSNNEMQRLKKIITESKKVDYSLYQETINPEEKVKSLKRN